MHKSINLTLGAQLPRSEKNNTGTAYKHRIYYTYICRIRTARPILESRRDEDARVKDIEIHHSTLSK
jgi:hypothetical protein